MSGLLPDTGTCWLTGAGTGIGLELGRRLLAEGHSLVVTGRRRETLEQLVSSENRSRLTIATADTTSSEDLSRVATQISEQGPLTLAILNAGTCEYVDVAEFSSDVIAANIETNVLGTARCIEVALPLLRDARRQGLPATLVIISSSAWWFPFGRAEGYGASKAALTYMAQSLRADLSAEGIEVVVVSPGFVRTPLTDRNDFPMPGLIDADDAAARILHGLRKGRKNIEFPRRFTWTLRALGNLPQGLIDRLAARMTRKSNQGS